MIAYTLCAAVHVSLSVHTDTRAMHYIHGYDNPHCLNSAYKFNCIHRNRYGYCRSASRNGLIVRAESWIQGSSLFNMWQAELKLTQSPDFPKSFGEGQVWPWIRDNMGNTKDLPADIIAFVILELLKSNNIHIVVHADADDREASQCRLGNIKVDFYRGQTKRRFSTAANVQPFGKFNQIIGAIQYDLTAKLLSTRITELEVEGVLTQQATTTLNLMLQIDAGPYSGTYHMSWKVFVIFGEKGAVKPRLLIIPNK